MPNTSASLLDNFTPVTGRFSSHCRGNTQISLLKNFPYILRFPTNPIIAQNRKIGKNLCYPLRYPHSICFFIYLNAEHEIVWMENVSRICIVILRMTFPALKLPHSILSHRWQAITPNYNITCFCPLKIWPNMDVDMIQKYLQLCLCMRVRAHTYRDSCL